MSVRGAEEAGLRAAEVAAWCVHVWVLAQLLPAPDLGRVLFALVFSGCIASILTVGWKTWLRDPARDPGMAWSAAFAGLAARCLVALPVMALISWHVGGGVLYPAPQMPVLIGMLAGITAVLRLAASALRAGGERSRAAILTGPLPVLLALAAVFLTADRRPLTFEVVLGLHAVCLLAAMVLAVRRLPPLRWKGELPRARVFVDSVTQSGTIIFRNIDIMVIGIALTPIEAAIYLIVRGVAMLLDLQFRVLARILFDPIARCWRDGERLRFVSLAARANLGFLLIGGAVAILLFVAMDPVLHVFGIPATEGRLPLVWLIIAQSAPVIFGATNLFMRVTHLEGLRGWIVWAAMPLALILTFTAARDGLVPLAATYAALQVGAAAICAMVVAVNCGIWPGLTALFHNRIRLR